MLIAADVTAKIDGRWGAGRPTCYSGYPAHPNSAGRPTGGNQAYVDGSVSWKKFEQMIFIHSWNPGGSRQYYAYQEDLGDYGKSGRNRQAALLTAAPCRTAWPSRPIEMMPLSNLGQFG